MDLSGNKPKTENEGLLGEPPRFEFPKTKNPLIFLLHSYKLVKDLRTGVEMSDVEGALDG